VASTYEPIASHTLGSAAASYEFTSIPGTFTDLIIVFGGSAAGTGYISVQVNSDTGSNYSSTLLRGTGSAASSARYSSQVEMYVSQGNTLSTDVSDAVLMLLSYANTNVFKTVLTSAGNAGIEVDRGVSLWRSTSAITSVKLLGSQNFSSGSTFSLFGVKAA
jgi:hypothetical protein